MAESDGDRPRHSREEFANSVSHGIGLVALLVAVPFLLDAAFARGGLVAMIAAGVFGGAAILVYLASALHHGLSDGRAKRAFEVLDHAAIFLLIAGTYTPFTLGVLRGAWGWVLFGLVWTLAAVGVALAIGGGDRFPAVSIGLYLGMGWIIVIAVRPLVLRMPTPGLLLLLAGGLAYTIGVGFYAAKRLRFNHLIWHLFVLSGTALHFLAVLWYAA